MILSQIDNLVSLHRNHNVVVGFVEIQYSLDAVWNAIESNRIELMRISKISIA